MENVEQLNGQRVTVHFHKRENGEVYEIVLILDDGTELCVTPSSYNYGPQELLVR